MPKEAAGSAPAVDGQCDRRPSAPQRRICCHCAAYAPAAIHAASAQRCPPALAAPSPLAIAAPPPRSLPGRAARPANRGGLASKGQEQHN
eukprot:5789968-Pleurochrysis_carterae.AAC.1